MTLGHSVLVTPAADSPLTPWPTTARSGGVGSGSTARGPVFAEVVSVSPKGLYLLVPGTRHPSVIPLLTSDALALPTGVRLGRSSGEVAWGVHIGDRVTLSPRRTARGLLGWGVELPGQRVQAVRTWRPARVAQAPKNTLHAGRSAAALLGSAPTPTNPDGPLGGGEGLRELVARAVLARDPRRAVRALIGLGPGLTPSGDDALAGALLVLHGLGRAALLAEAVRDHLSRTTALSASLLVAAMDGYAVPTVVAFVDAVMAGDEATAASTRHAVGAIGHWSGRDLVAGVTAALAAVSTGADVDDSQTVLAGASAPLLIRSAP